MLKPKLVSSQKKSKQVFSFVSLCALCGFILFFV